MNIAKESFYTLLFQVSGFVCATIAGIITARVLGPANKGIIALVLLYPALFFTIFNLSIGLGIIHHMGKRTYDVKTFTGSTLILLICASILAAAIFSTTVVSFKDTLYKGIDLRYLIIVGAVIPFYLMLYFFSSLLQGSMNIQHYNIANQLPAFTNIGLILAFILVGGLTTTTAILAAISGVILGGMFAFYHSTRHTQGFLFSKKLTIDLIKDGAKIQIGAIATFLYTQANLFILNYYRTPYDVGIYSVAYNIANILFIFSVALETGLYPKVAHATMDEAIRLVQIATRQIILITMIAALFMALLSKWLILVYGGPAFLPATKSLLLLLPGVVVFVIPKIIATLWIRKGWFMQLTIIAGSTALISIAFNLTLIPKYGAEGAAIATTLTFGVSSLIALFLFRRFVSKNLRQLIIPNRQDFTVYQDGMRAIYSKFLKTK